MLAHAFWFDAGRFSAPVLRPSEYILNFQMSRIAVLLFFITSGYVIGLTNRQPFSADLAKEYLRRRILRIGPIYALAIVAGYLAFRNTSLWTILENALFLQNPAWHIPQMPGNLPLWSLHNEVVYYLGFLLLWAFQPRVIPFVFALLAFAIGDWFLGGPLSFLGGWSVGAIFWLAGLLLAWNRIPHSPQGAASVLSLVLLAFATNQLWPGVILLRGLGFPYAGESTLYLSDLIFLPVALMIFCGVTNLDFPGRRLVSWVALLTPLATVVLLQRMGRLWENVPWTMGAVATVGGLLIMPFDQRRWGEHFFRLFRPLGRISYALYLFHVPVVALVGATYPWTGTWPNYIGGFLTWLALSILLAWICEAKLQTALLSFYKRRKAGLRTACH